MFCYILSSVKLGLEFIDGTLFYLGLYGKSEIEKKRKTPEDFDQGTVIIQTPSFATSKTSAIYI